MARSLKGLALLVGKGPKDDEEEAPPDSEEGEGGGDEDSYLKEAFSAAKEDDEDGFMTAMKGAIRACIDSYGGGK
jgi:hypothetical protein